MIPIETLNFWLSLCVVLMEIVTIGFLGLYFLRTTFPDLNDVADLVSDWGLWIGLGVTSFGVFLTLYYSEILGLTPCGWCWIQRVFLYPLPILFAIALRKKDRAIADYAIALSVFGAAAALYQHYLQMGGHSVLPCPATSDQAIDCAVRFVFEFGYVTFPFMAFSLFSFLIVVMLFVRRRN